MPGGAKIILLVLSTLAFVKAIIPPRPATEGRKPVYKGQFFELAVRHITSLACIFVTCAASSHSFLLLSEYTEGGTTTAISLLCPAPHNSFHESLKSLAGYPTRFFIGIALVGVGCLLRLMAYRALGSLFTYEVVIKDDHRLITTGPYGYVRHPSYTGATLLLLGAHLIHFGEGGYITQCRIADTPLVTCVVVWDCLTVFSVISLYRRCNVEEAQLRERFGAIWEAYCRDVPWRLVPYMY